ncbi:MAG: polynucleotide adenylyltransferase PcnB [Treponemataceae bacterium]|nr:polynucleotide adenylyltransferase PcnB [Treponemataceae bacterium]
MLIRYGTDSKGRPVKKAVVYTKNEHKIQKNLIDHDAVSIIIRLKEAGFHSYIVGGAVRDLICDNIPKDFDIVTDATPSRIKRLFRNSRIIGRRFRIVHVVFGSKIFEVSTFRSNADGTSIGNEFGNMDEDVRRRDFTINALYYDPLQEQVIDYVGGVRDIKKHVLRSIIPLDRIFVEDPVRMLRAIKYSAKTGAKISFALRHKIRRSAPLLSQISPSRLTEEFLKILNSGCSSEIVADALDTDLYMVLQPVATSLIYSDKNFESSYMQNLRNLDRLCKNDGNARLGKKLVFIIKDFVYSLTDWKEEIHSKTTYSELYARTWTECRQFVLPINPQRTELEYAVRFVLHEMGINGNPPKQKRRSKTKQKQEKDKKNS